MIGSVAVAAVTRMSPLSIVARRSLAACTSMFSFWIAVTSRII
jgi:hypothetical protein